MHLVYIDDSVGERYVCFSALSIPVDSWQDALDHLIGMRRQLWASDQIYVRKELHATEFVSGHGRVSPHIVPKGARVRIYEFVLSSITLMPGVQLFNATSHVSVEERLFERLLNRINVNMRRASSHAIIISDEGKNYDWMVRKMRRMNFIPSRYGIWVDGTAAKNITLDRIVEDLVYRNSARSLFVQAADFCAYALLRRERPIPSKNKYGLNRSLMILEPVMVKAANGYDPLGIVRA